MNFITEIRRMLGRMGAEERRRAVEALRELIYEDAYERTCPTDDGDNVACRRCGQPRFQPCEHAPLPARGVPRRISRREHEAAGRIPRMVPVASHIPRRRAGLRRTAGQRHRIPRDGARMVSRHPAVHGLLGRGRVRPYVQCNHLRKGQQHGEYANYHHAFRL